MKRYLVLIALVCLIVPMLALAGHVRSYLEEREEGKVDADLGRFSTSISKADYFRLREQMVAKLRGYPYDGPGNPRAEAIRELERQERIQKEKDAQARNNATASSRPNEPQISAVTWTPLGPDPIPDGQTNFNNGSADPSLPRNPVSGRVLAITIDPTNTNIAYVGTAQGGLYRTTNAQAASPTWTPLMDNALTLAVDAITIDPLDHTTLFVGTGEGNFCVDCFFGVGYYIIKNADTTPTLLGPYNSATNTANGFMAHSRSITKILIVPNNDNTIFVATGSGANGINGGGGNGPDPTPRGLFRCDNAMSGSPTCTKLNVNGPNGGINTAVRDIVFDPGDATNNSIWVGVDDSIAGGTNGVYLTTNALNADPTTITFTRKLQTAEFTNVMLAIQKTGSTVTLYAATEDDGTTALSGTVRRTTDGGNTWTQLTSANGFCDSQCFYDMPIAVDPTDANKVYIGGNGDYDAVQSPFKKSTNAAGASPTFVKASIGLHPDAHVITVDPTNPSIIYTGNDGGIFRTTDAGTNWTSLNTTGFSATQFMSLAQHPTISNFLIGGTQDNGTPFRQTNGVWKLGDFGDGGYALIDRNATNEASTVAYHTYFNAQLAQIGFVRADGASDINPSGWDTLPYGCFTIGGVPASTNGITCSDNTLFYAPMALGPNSADSAGANTLYFGSDHLYRSPDKGVTMSAVSQIFEPDTSGAAPPANTPVSAIGISPQDDLVRMVGISSGRVFATTTGAAAMIEVTPPVTPKKFIGRAVFDPSSSSTAYVTLVGYGVPNDQHIWKTTNLTTANLATSAVTWTAAGHGLPDVPVNAFVIDPANTNHLYAGTDIGVYVSLDGGAIWTTFSNGLPRVAVFDMGIQPSSKMLRIATHGRGIWEIPVLGPTAANGTISGQITTGEGAPLGGVSVSLSGSKNTHAITDSMGRYSFSDLSVGEFYTVTPARANYSFSPSSRSISLNSDTTDAEFTATPDAVSSTNAIDSADFFVRQHYLDFLDREPDQGGLDYWRTQIEQCGVDETCLHNRRIDVSAAYFIEAEFQQTGSFVYGLYKAALGRNPRFAEFMPDRSRISVGEQLEQSKQALTDEWVTRSEFRSAYPDSLSNAEFVNKLCDTAGLTGNAGERASYTTTLNNGGSRAQVLRSIIESNSFKAKEYNRAFVLTEYFGYLRRDPDQGGFDFWVNVLDSREPNNYRGMVCSFITSAEYQKRFSSVVTHSNAECGQ